MKRVVVTGQGTINALGASAPETLAALREGRCGIGPLELRDADRLSIRIGAQVRDFVPEQHFNRQQIALYDRFAQFALLAAEEAVAQSGLAFDGELAVRSGVVLGTAGGGTNTWDENYRTVYEEGKNRVHPFVVPKLMNSAAASHISMRHHLMGPGFTVATACASSRRCRCCVSPGLRIAGTPFERGPRFASARKTEPAGCRRGRSWCPRSARDRKDECKTSRHGTHHRFRNLAILSCT